VKGIKLKEKFFVMLNPNTIQEAAMELLNFGQRRAPKQMELLLYHIIKLPGKLPNRTARKNQGHCSTINGLAEKKNITH
jgi:hypothetical protein